MFEIRPLTLKNGIYSIILISMLMILGSCRDGGSDMSGNQNTSSQSSTTNRTSSSENPGVNNIMAGTSNAAGSSASSNASGQYHYICANNCEGSGSDSSGTCPVCGETLLHNDAYHSSASAESITLPDAGTSFNVQPAGGGQHHFVCSAGCGDGGTSQGNCPSCGAALVHNDAYHAQQTGNINPVPQASSGQSMGDPKVKYPSVFNSPSAPRASVPQGGGGTGHHYICSAGCGGGGASQGSCPSCGATLVHNDAFHQ